MNTSVDDNVTKSFNILTINLNILYILMIKQHYFLIGI